ncbi:MAG: radical SAM protein [Phycisphaerae bacterium]|nr:radical SAM protein [Phycisphaerae bacterium]
MKPIDQTLSTSLDRFQPALVEISAKLDPCSLCPRHCKSHRRDNQHGFCGVGAAPRVSSAGPHFGEESILVGSGGSGTIFFSGCNLGCVFCQNADISHGRRGRDLTVDQLVEIMLNLQRLGCVNINLVSPSHFAAPIAEAIVKARRRRLSLPIVYNTGGYDDLETLRLLDGMIDIYMPDMKFATPDSAEKCASARDYPEVNRAAVLEMHRQVGDLEIRDGLAVHGLLVRHLVLPDDLAGSAAILDFLATSVSPTAAVNVMAQYHPCHHAFEDPTLRLQPSARHIYNLRSYAASLSLRLID